MTHQNDLYETAIKMLHRRTMDIAVQTENLFPLFREKNQEWVLSRRGSWLSGFWLGMCRMKNENDQLIQKITAQILSLPLNDSIHMAFVYFYGFCDSSTLNNEESNFLKLYIQHLIKHFDERMQSFPCGKEMGGKEIGQNILAIDALAPLIGLHTLIPTSDYEDKLKKHINTICHVLIEPQGSCRHQAFFNKGKWSVDSGNLWPRGQAWGTLGLAYASSIWRGSYIETAEKLINYWIKQFGYIKSDEIAKSPRDCSAFLIIIQAIFHLPPEANRTFFTDYAHANLNDITRSYIDTENDEFYGCLYEVKPGKIRMVESIWVNYFLLKSLLSFKNYYASSTHESNT